MKKEILISEFKFKAIRSSGPGGQHVNKVSSKVVLSINIESSNAFSEAEKERLFNKLSSKLTKENELIISSEKTRSQVKNKEFAIEKCIHVIKEALIVPKKRKPTKPSKNSRKKKRETKTQNSLKKKLRKKPGLD